MNEEEKVVDVNPEEIQEETATIPDEPIMVFASGRFVPIERDLVLNDQLKINVESCKKGINEFTAVIGKVVADTITDEEVDKYLESMTNELVRANLFKITEYTDFSKKEMVVMMATTLISFFSTIIYVAAHEYVNTEGESEATTEAAE